MKIYLATDHAGFEHKESVKGWLIDEGYEVLDCGATSFDAEDDFTDFVSKAAKAIARDTSAKAIVFGGSGNGEAMMANRFKDVRAAVYYGGDMEIVRLSRQHNDANILSIGARFVSIDEAKGAIWEWLHTDALPQKKYERRNDELDILSDKQTFSTRVNSFLEDVSDILAKEV